MSEFTVRRVVTGFDANGTDVITDDAQAPNTVSVGLVGVSELFWTDGSGLRVADDPDRSPPGFPLEPPPGGISVRIIRMPGIPPGTEASETWLRVDGDDPDVAGMHATDTLDLMVVLEGSVVLGLADGERTVTAGEYVIQRGTRHRWRPADHRGWTYMVAMLRPIHDRAAGVLPDGLRPPTVGDSPVRRVVTGDVTIDGGAVTTVGSAFSTLTDVWLTGGPLRAVDQGGDVDGGWALEPVEGGVSFRLVELSPEMPMVDELWHATATVDVDVIVSGRVRLDLPGEVSTELGPGDVVVQRGTDHRWVAVGDEPLRMATVMIDADT